MSTMITRRPSTAHSEAAARLKRKRIMMTWIVTISAAGILFFWLLPLGYAGVTSLKTKDQATQTPILPTKPVIFEWPEGSGEEYEVFKVPTEDGVRDLALVNRGRESSEFLDIENPEAGLIPWEGRWRQLEPALDISFAWGNYREAWNTINFPRLLFWTTFYASITMVAAVVSSALVAYGFARFRFRGRGVLFLVMMATVILPPAVTQVPSYAFFTWIGWTGTWLPLIVPTFFAYATNVFLLRQYFLTIPAEMEQAAAVDGAGPFRTFLAVIVPQAIPAFTAVSLFHFFFAWNDFFGPLIYLISARDKQPISVGLTLFNGVYDTEPQLIMAASFITLVIPLVIFFFAQRIFVQGIVITGVDK